MLAHFHTFVGVVACVAMLRNGHIVLAAVAGLGAFLNIVAYAFLCHYAKEHAMLRREYQRWELEKLEGWTEKELDLFDSLPPPEPTKDDAEGVPNWVALLGIAAMGTIWVTVIWQLCLFLLT